MVPSVKDIPIFIVWHICFSYAVPNRVRSYGNGPMPKYVETVPTRMDIVYGSFATCLVCVVIYAVALFIADHRKKNSE